MQKEQLIRRVSEQIMLRRGYGSYTRNHIEWDETNSNSQFSLVIEDITEVLEVLDSEGVLVNIEATE